MRVTLHQGEPAQAAAARVLLALLDAIEDNLPGALEGVEIEFLHDLRVAVRRTRAVQRELKALFPARQLAAFRAEFKWLQQITGEARDLDVYVEGFAAMRRLVSEPASGDLDGLLAILAEHRARAHEEMREHLRSARTSRLLAGWRRALGRIAAGAAADPPVERIVAHRITRVYRRMVKMGQAIGPGSPAQEYHELRKKGKELRYLLELFGGSLFDERVVEAMVKRLKALQDVLGRHQDREVQQATVRALAGEVTEPATLLAMGMLLARLADEERAARAEFAQRFAEFAAPAQRRSVKRHFG